jgi:catechol 2,3-dioxygenase
MPVVRGLAEVVLWVHDLPAALAFYRDLLGLPVISPPERANPIFLQAGPGTAGIPAMVVLVQLPPDAPPFSLPRPLHHLALEVAAADFDALRERLAAAGHAIRTGQHPIIPSRTMYVDDPDGNEVEFICPAERRTES